MASRARPACIALLLVYLAALSGCRGCGSEVDPVEADFRVDPTTQSLEFGRVLEGTAATRTVLVHAQTRASLTLTASTAAPFDAPKRVDLPGGGQVELTVTFLAGDGEVTGTLELAGGKRTVEVLLHGTGVRPKVCTPSAACLESSYSLELDRCVETQSPDDTACDPGNVCLEDGRCRAGLCLGVARSCDDNNACTSDGCSMVSGCVNTPRSCPRPVEPCQVATCDPVAGCGQGPAEDGLPCGSADCVTGHFCVSGACVELPVPEGAVCGLSIACLPEPRCHDQKCVPGDAGPWLPRWSAPVVGQPSTDRPALLASANALFFNTCGLPRPPDAGVDAGPEDDGGLEDAGWDGGEPDGGETDGGGDGGEDAGGGGEDDGGVCALASWTSSGFDRYVAPYEIEGVRHLLALTPRGVLLAHDGGLELRSRLSGALLEALDVRPPPGGIAVSTDAGIQLITPEGTLALWADAGLVPVVALGGEAVLALDGHGALYAWQADAGALFRVSEDGDGGSHIDVVQLDAGSPSLLATFGGALADGRQQVRWLSDGGLEQFDLSWWSDAGVLLDPLPRAVLASRDSVVLFARQCPSPFTSCLPTEEETWVRATDLRTGAVRWETQVLPAGSTSRLEEVALLDALPGTVAALVEADFTALDAGVGAFLQVFAEGKRALLCPLPHESSRLRGALFAPGSLYLFADHGDGGVVLEAYDLNGLPLSFSGWPQPDGIDGLRRAMP